MASIQTPKASKFWHAYYRDARGVLRCKSTKVPHTPPGATAKDRASRAAENRRLAQEIATRFEEAERGNAVEVHLRKIVADIGQRVNRRRVEFAQARTFLLDWVERAGKTKSPATAARYRGTISAFLDSLGHKADAALADITPADVQRFAVARLEGGRNPTTVSVDLKTVNGPFALALRQGLVIVNPVPAAEIPAGEKEAREPFTATQVAALLEAAPSIEWRTAILFGGLCGMRLGDAVSMRWENVELPRRLIRFRPQKTQRRKRDLEVPLHPLLETHLLAMPAADDPKTFLCPTLARATIGGRRGLSRQFQAIMGAAGIEQITVEPAGPAGRTFNKRGFHSLRHAFVSLLLNEGVAADLRQKLAGHADERTHARYSHAEAATLRRAVETIKLPNHEQSAQ